MESNSTRKPGRIRRWIKTLVICAMLGFATTVAVAWACAYWPDEGWRDEDYEQILVHGQRVSIQTNSRFGATIVEVECERGLPYAAINATGKPDYWYYVNETDEDAWAPATPEGPHEWLELTYAQPVRVQQIRWYANNGPGTVDSITAFDPSGRETTVWQGVDPTRQGVSNVTVGTIVTQRIKLHLNTKLIAGWNEIDAVELIDADGQGQFAVSATSSSSRTEHSDWKVVGRREQLNPRWGLVPTFLDNFANGNEKRASRTIDARGWPFLALWSPRAEDSSNVSAPTGGLLTYFRPKGSELSFQLPYRPIWSGLLLNTLAYTPVFLLIHLVMINPRRWLRQVNRMKRGCCIHCGYDLRYDFQKGCPECGWQRQ